VGLASTIHKQLQLIKILLAGDDVSNFVMTPAGDSAGFFSI
jgi:hypothetical protein